MYRLVATTVQSGCLKLQSRRIARWICVTWWILAKTIYNKKCWIRIKSFIVWKSWFWPQVSLCKGADRNERHSQSSRWHKVPEIWIWTAAQLNHHSRGYATGKTTLVDMIRTHMNDGESGPVTLNCDKRCYVVEGNLWKGQLDNIQDSICFYRWR